MRHLPLAAISILLVCCAHPSDAELLERFETHQAEFLRLVAMSDTDSTVIRIASDFTRLDSNWGWPRAESLLGFSQDRWDQYRSLFRRLKLQSGLSREKLSDSTPVVFLTAHSVGIVNRGSSKGYAYARRELEPVLLSLDTDLPSIQGGKKHGVAYRKIGSGWYLALDW
jgi:hypothetical protein